MSAFVNQIKQQYQRASIVEKVIYINILIFIISYPLIRIYGDTNILFDLFSLPSNLEKLLVRPWSLMTYGFLHASFWHILFNMLLLYYLGNLFLDFFSREQFLTYFIGGVLVGGVTFLLSYNLLPSLKNISTVLVGASAGVTAIVIGLATKTPNYALHFRFIGAIQLKYIAIAILAIDITMILFEFTITNKANTNIGGRISHLGGALFGFLLTYQFNDGKEITNYFLSLFSKKKQKPLKTVYKKEKPLKNINKSEQQEKIDAILDKISKSGYDSLTQKEKDLLFSVGKNS